MDELLQRLKVRIPDEQDDELLSEMLMAAGDIILSLRFPFGVTKRHKRHERCIESYESDEEELPDEPEVPEYHITRVPREYRTLQLLMAEDMYNRIGAAGQLSHTENSIGRTWGSEWVSRDLLLQITPKCGGLK